MSEERVYLALAAICSAVAIAFQVFVALGELWEPLGLAASASATWCCFVLCWAVLPLHYSLAVIDGIKRVLGKLSTRRS